MATVAARYSSCAAVEIGESCCPETRILECTPLPELIEAPDGRTIVSGPHEVTRCEPSENGYTCRYMMCAIMADMPGRRRRLGLRMRVP